MEGGLPWHQAIIKCANDYKKKKLADNLDETFADYKMKRELNIPLQDDVFDSAKYSIKNSDVRLEQILTAREVNGEPRDWNF